MRKIIAHVGNDVHQEFTQAAVYEEDEQKPRIEKHIKTEKSAVQKFYKKLSKKYEIKACYEAGRSGAIGQWFDRLIERGLKFEDGILFIIDGAKGIRKPIRQKFGPYALVQRCRWHKCENVVSYLSDADKVIFRRRLQDAYNKTTHKEAVTALRKIHGDLEKIRAG